jgi:hemoglobin
MKKDIETRADLESVLRAFYTKVFDDDLIRHFFTEVVPLDLKHHIPVITDFWESVVLGTHGYRRNVMDIHQQISRLSPLNKVHLDRWVQLFTATVGEFFEGPNAERMKQRAASIATLMDIRINHPNPLKHG